MPKKYHIHVSETPHRYPVIGRSGIVDWGEGCLKCPVCVKQECVYRVYGKRFFSVDILGDTADELCKNCYRCIQGCPKRLIHKTLNPEWEALGDEVYTPEVISVNWEQARSGKIPVSGAGYGGAYVGAGFDSMWTDMSEIVRPTRDGIHGREYISTVVDIGRRPAHLAFDESGALTTQLPASIKIPIPVVFDILPFGDLSAEVFRAMARAAAEIGTRMVVRRAEASKLTDVADVLIPLLEESDRDADWIQRFGMVEILDDSEALARIAELKAIKEDLIVAVRVPAVVGSIGRTVDLARNGVEVVHCAADERGYEPGRDNGRHIQEVIREAHAALLGAGIRDEVTFLASGGVAMAEHVVKAMLCGANCVGIDLPLLIALECRVCRNCADGGECPVRISGIDSDWGSRRIVNLVAAWHNQILEMMGAMGIREARRLRGEQGRVMFYEDLEAETFGKMFSSRNSR